MYLPNCYFLPYFSSFFFSPMINLPYLYFHNILAHFFLKYSFRTSHLCVLIMTLQSPIFF